MQSNVTQLSAAALVLTLALDMGTAAAQDSKKPATKADIARPIPETVVNSNAFSGNEIRLAAMNYVNTDCSSGPLPDLRFVTTPQNGEYRLEQITIPIDRKAGDLRASCNGKPVNAVGVFYKSKSDFTGNENIVIDVDFKTGTVRRFNYKITIR